MRKHKTESTGANSIGLVGSNEKALSYPDTAKINFLNINRIQYLQDFEKNKSCIFNATSSHLHPKIKGVEYKLAELFFSKNGKLLSDEDNYEIMYFDEIQFPTLSDLFRFLFDFSNETTFKLYPDFEICFISINGAKPFRWVYTYAHWCYSEGKITEDVLIDMMMNDVTNEKEFDLLTKN